MDVWLPVGQCYTYVIKRGTLQPQKPLMLIIPGNPGVGDNYKEFMKSLHERSGEAVAVWCVSHAGHVTKPSTVPRISSNEGFRNLNGQIEHKLKFIKEYIPDDTPLIMIGHSIGCYMIMKIMAQLPPNRVLQSVFLFPTIERMAISPKGKTFMRHSGILGTIGHLPVYPLYYLTPNFVRYYITKLYFMGTVPESVIEATLRLVNPECVANSIFLARTEMEQVVHADHEFIDNHIDKLMFYYGKSDHWCPLEYANDMIAAHPTADVKICERGFQHAFVLTNSIGMAEVLWDWLTEKLPAIFSA